MLTINQIIKVLEEHPEYDKLIKFSQIMLADEPVTLHTKQICVGVGIDKEMDFEEKIELEGILTDSIQIRRVNATKVFGIMDGYSYSFYPQVQVQSKGHISTITQ